MNKKLTYNEIIEALGRCGYHQECCFCNSVEECGSKKVLVENTLDFINRQQTENKRLGKEVNLVSIQFQDLQERYEEAQAEIERFRKTEIEIDDFCRRLCRMRMLNGNAIASYEDLQNYIQQEKSEAIKEFAEKLKHSFFDNGYESPDVDFDYFVDNLTKEMVGDK